MRQDRLIIILADISGYTRFMIENRTSAVHGQLCINSLIEAILSHVDIPLTLQEIEGDAVFLYARYPGSEQSWQTMAREISEKLDRREFSWRDRMLMIWDGSRWFRTGAPAAKPTACERPLERSSGPG